MEVPLPYVECSLSRAERESGVLASLPLAGSLHVKRRTLVRGRPVSPLSDVADLTASEVAERADSLLIGFPEVLAR